MKRYLLKFLQVLLLTFSVSALIAQVPDGGIMLNNEGAYQKIGPGTLTKVSVEGQSFTEALRYVVGSGFDNVWNVQIRFPAVNGIEVDDIILVAFYARSVSSQEETGEGYVTVVLEDNINYAKEISSQISFGSEWKEYYASAKSSVSLAANEVNYTFFCGYENQTIEIADVRFLNYKNTLNLEDLPFTKISYNGQEPDAPWRAEATERIQQLRKGPVDIMVYDESGNPAEGATVSVEMKKHQFKFGSAVALSPYISNSVYKEKIFELFNEIVWENDLKWPALDPNSDYPQLKNALMELADSGVTVRGHNIIWPSWQFTPDYLETLKDDTVALRREITNRIEHAATFTKGYVIDWDVINETYTNYDIMDILGYEEMADWFKRTRYYDKDVKLYMNDYSILSSSGKDVKHQDHYFETIQYIDELGGDIDGIGMQGHFGGSLTAIPKLYEILDRFATLGKEIKITEFDVDIDQSDVQAEYVRDFMTQVYSHPSVNGILTWGFWAGQHWKPDAAYYNLDWTIRPHGQMYIDLVFDEWWTSKTDSVTNASGEASFEGFLGEYNYTVSYEGKERTGTFSIQNSFHSALSNPVIISLDEDIPDNVKIDHGTLILCDGEEVDLSVPHSEGLTYEWYKGSENLGADTSALRVNQPGFYSAILSKGSVIIHSDTIEVKVISNPTVEINAPEEIFICEGDEVYITTPETEDMIYTWRNGDKIVEGTVFSIIPSETGEYTVEAIQDGCSARSDTISVMAEENAIALIKSTESLSFCEGDSVRIYAYRRGDYSYLWMKDDEVLPETSYYFYAKESGDYKAIVSLNNCSSESNLITVNVLDPTDPACNVGIQPELSGIKIYPNPFKEKFFLELDKSLINAGSVEIYNSLGSLVYLERIENLAGKTEIPLMQKGLYIVKITGKEMIQNIRLIGE